MNRKERRTKPKSGRNRTKPSRLLALLLSRAGAASPLVPDGPRTINPRRETA